MRKIAILGSTGSIGTQALEVVRANKDMKVTALAAGGSSIDLLEQQAREFQPKIVCVWNRKMAEQFRIRTGDMRHRVVCEMKGLLETVVESGADIVLTAVVGMVGIQPTLAAINAGMDVALANKETLVTAGHLIMPFAREKGVKILPVDSEHSAIFQVLHGERPNPVSRILLTCSGGPFRGCTKAEMRNVQVEDALKHPNWAMGRKITIDSATMVNKGLEVMEAGWLFRVPLSKVEVVVQPQSVIHSMVEFADGAVLAQLGTPDMKLPIQYALYYPERRFLAGERLDFAKLGQITFEAPDMENFPGLALAYQAGTIGGTMPTVFNAANEWAVARFLDRKLGFLEITELIQAAMEQHTVTENPTVEQILETEQSVYEFLNHSGK